MILQIVFVFYLQKNIFGKKKKLNKSDKHPSKDLFKRMLSGIFMASKKTYIFLL